MSRVPTVRKADLDRVLNALKDAGLAPAAIVVRPGGEVVITPGPAEAAPSADAPPLTTSSSPGQPQTLEDWRARKRARGGRAA